MNPKTEALRGLWVSPRAPLGPEQQTPAHACRFSDVPTLSSAVAKSSEDISRPSRCLCKGSIRVPFNVSYYDYYKGSDKFLFNPTAQNNLKALP